MAFARFADAEELSKRDQLKMAAQQICPVSGQKLGTHGAPVKVKIGRQELFLCCQPCLQGKVEAKHWAAIHANFTAAQASCPVMNKPLPKSPKWTIVDGQIVYICCPPCADKIKAEPGEVPEQGRRALCVQAP